VTETAAEPWPTMSKREVAARLVDRLVAMLHNKA
jgi:hypothetical protein